MYVRIPHYVRPLQDLRNALELYQTSLSYLEA